MMKRDNYSIGDVNIHLPCVTPFRNVIHVVIVKKGHYEARK